MHIDEIKETFLEKFNFLKELGYLNITIYERAQQSYDWGIVLENPNINQKLSFAYYSYNPLYNTRGGKLSC
jgi:hypothetical protein